MMRDEISKLLLDIRGTMKDFSRGKMDLAAAEEAWAQLGERCALMEEELLNDDAAGLIEGALYRHNTSNFSHHSGLYHGRSGGTVPLVHCGDSATAALVAAALTRNLSRDAPPGLRHLEPESTGGLSHTVHVMTVARGPEPVHFASLSSSPHFSDETFTSTGSVLRLMVKGHVGGGRHYSYFTETKKKAERFIGANVDQNHDIMTSIFIFRNIEKIFLHMGIITILDVSENIKLALANAFPAGSLCVNPSFRMYLVFTRHLKNRGAELKNTKVEFVYRGITLPFQRLNLPLDASSRRDGLWYDIFQFEDYVLTGDYY